MIRYYVRARTKDHHGISVGPLSTAEAADQAAVALAGREDLQGSIVIESYSDKETE